MELVATMNTAVVDVGRFLLERRLMATLPAHVVSPEPLLPSNQK